MRDHLFYRLKQQTFLRHTPIVYFVALLVATGLPALFSHLGYELIVTIPAVWFILSLLPQIVFTAMCLINVKNHTKLASAVSLTLPILSVAYTYFTDSFIQNVPEWLIVPQVLICFLCSFIITVPHVIDTVFHAIISVINTLLLLAFLALMLLMITFGSLGERTMIKEQASPDERYVAMVISSDSGALGGGTYVLAEETPPLISLGYGRIAKRHFIYSGDWDAYQTLHLRWILDHTLLINGIEQTIPD